MGKYKMSVKLSFLSLLYSFLLISPSIAEVVPRVNFGTNNQHNNGLIAGRPNDVTYPEYFYRNLSKKMPIFIYDFYDYVNNNTTVPIEENTITEAPYVLLELTISDSVANSFLNTAPAKGIYIFDKKEKPVGFCLIEQKPSTNHPEYSFSAAPHIKSLSQNPEYLKNRLVIPDGVQITFYENRENNLIERYAIISMFDPYSNRTREFLALDAYYPLELERELEVDIIAYLNKSLMFNPFE